MLLFLHRVGSICHACVRSFVRSERVTEEGIRIPLTPPLRLRYFFEDLGGVFFKLGQMLAMRFDILPMRYAIALFDLFDNVSPLPNEVLFAVFREECGVDISLHFSIDPQPLASASFAQVYRGEYDGESIVVKIQKPGAAQYVHTDLAILRGLLWLSKPLRLLRVVHMKEIVAQLEEWLIDELDYRREAANGTVMYTHIQNRHLQDRVVVPKIYEEFTRPRVLVESFISGTTVNNLIRQTLSHRSSETRVLFDPITVSNFFIRDLMRQYFVDHFFQADPHPGNLMVLPGNTICFIDFGIIGRPASATHHFCEFVYGIINLDAKKMAHGMIQFAAMRLRDELGDTGKDTKSEQILQVTLAFLEERLAEEFRPIMFEWHAMTGDASLDLSKRSSSVAFFRIVRVLEQYGIRLPSDIIAFIRALLIIDMVCLRLALGFNMVKAAHSFFEEYPLSTIDTTGWSHQSELHKLREIKSLNTDLEHKQSVTARQKERELFLRERLTDWVYTLADRYSDLYDELKEI